MNIKEITDNALLLAVKRSKRKKIAGKIPNGDFQKLHALRAREWVEALAETFRKYYDELKEPNVRVFSKYSNYNRKDFGLNELLFDISVVKTATIQSPRHKELTYIEKALWIVESEMANDTRQLVLDFSKLVMGDAENKLFVGPLSEEIFNFIPQLCAVARNCNGLVHLCLVPHPEKWEKDETKLKMWFFESNKFIEIN